MWLCLDFYRLPVEVFADKAKPAAVAEKKGSCRRVVACNGPASHEGIRLGFSLTAAVALAPGLEVLERRPDLEQQALEQLAAWAGQYSSLVNLGFPGALLLEIGGSLKLFGGLQTLTRQLAAGLKRQGYSAFRSVAPTALGALWLARAGAETVITHPDRLAGSLGRLPLGCLGWPEQVRRGLAGLGVRTIRDCLRLPRDGFARRFGPDRLNELDRALGKVPEVLTAYLPPDRFTAELELPMESRETELLLTASERLLEELRRFLIVRQGAVDRFRLELKHRRLPATRVSLELIRFSRDPDHLGMLVAERLNRQQLPAPVTAVCLSTGPVTRLDPKNRALFLTPGQPDNLERQDGFRLVERLKARLGRDAVSGLCLEPEHRPEKNWTRTEGMQGDRPRKDFAGNFSGTEPDGKSGICPPRPLWFITRPEQLDVDCGQPCHQGRLALISGPERIETGWWDNEDVARDYYVASNRHDVRLWIFRERGGLRRWFLHGVFG